MRKYFIAQIETTKLFNALTDKFDIEISALVVSSINSVVFYNSVEEAKKVIDMMKKEYDDEGYFLQYVDEQLNYDGEGTGRWTVPYKLHNARQLTYAVLNADGKEIN